MPSTILITGGTAGLGRSTAKLFLSKGYTVIITGRSSRSIEAASSWITQEQPKASKMRLHTIQLDLDSFDSIRKAAESVKTLKLQLDIVFNNAGLQLRDREAAKETQRVERTIFVNAIAPWYFTLLLLPIVATKGRVLFVSSGIHDPEIKFLLSRNSPMLEKLDFDNLDGHKEYDGAEFYKISKLALFWLAYPLADQLKDRNISVTLCCPGFVPSTSMSRNYPYIAQQLVKRVVPLLIHSTTQDEAVSRYYSYATSGEFEGVTKVFLKHGKAIPSSKASLDEEKTKQFWNIACEVCSLPERRFVSDP